MKTITISKNEEGMRLNRFIKKKMPQMPDGLLHKLFRKKYFELNSKKASGKEILKFGDVILLFLAEDTFNKFSAVRRNENSFNENIDIKAIKDKILYEDDNIIIFDKPVNMLSQGDKSLDESVNEILNSYIRSSKKNETVPTFTPSIVNRLDRNTSGIIIFAKKYIAAKEISKMIRDNNLDKRYKAIVNGIIKPKEAEIVNLFKKDESNNKAIIRDFNGKIINGYSVVKLKYKLIEMSEKTSTIEIRLITGKSHQIRAQMAHIGYPIICDKKYMCEELYKSNVKEYGYKSQKLNCHKIIFGKFENDELKYLSNKQFVSRIEF